MGKVKTTRIMMATVPHVTSCSGLRKFQADGFFLDRVYQEWSSRRNYFCYKAWFASTQNCFVFQHL